MRNLVMLSQTTLGADDTMGGVTHFSLSSLPLRWKSPTYVLAMHCASAAASAKCASWSGAAGFLSTRHELIQRTYLDEVLFDAAGGGAHHVHHAVLHMAGPTLSPTQPHHARSIASTGGRRSPTLT
jgi:hypothetical protein